MTNKILGILGGGQLGKMLLQKAADYNIISHVLDPSAQAPCAHLCTKFVVGNFNDYDTVLSFGRECHIITIEIENVNTAALLQLENEGKIVFPQPHIIALIQDKGLQKQFYVDHHIPTAPYYMAQNKQEIKPLFPIIQKLRKEGYDGRGVKKIDNANMLHQQGFDAPSVIEEVIAFEKEIAVIAARNAHGEVTTFPVVEMSFNNEANLLDYLFAPANIDEILQQQANILAATIITKLNMIGILAVEMFVTKDGKLLVNEMAPRPHNSGHHTIEANYVSQFDMLLRCLYNMPLGSSEAHSAAVMFNVLGAKGYEGIAAYSGLEEVMACPGAHIHLYGKNTTTAFRKMGHVTIVGSQINEVISKALALKQKIKVVA